MITRIPIPQAFENMEEATIGRWIKQEGDAVGEGDALCELITEKTTFDLPAENLAPGENILRRIVAPEKSVVPVGYIIALAGAATDELPEVEAENRALLQQKQTASVSAADTATSGLTVPSLQVPLAGPASTPATGSRLRATPAARRAAREKGIELEAVAAAFPGKVLSEDDVNNFAAQ